jgi:hypothetical protein
VHVHAQAEQEGHAHAHAQRLVHGPEHQQHGQQVGHPGGAAPQAHVAGHVDQQREDQAQADEDRVGGQQQLLAGTHDHFFAPFLGVATTGSGRGGGSGSWAVIGLSTITWRADAIRAIGTQ